VLRPAGAAPVARAGVIRVATLAPGAPDREDEETYLSYFIDLMEHDVFKLIRKLLLHPNLCECNFFNNRIKLDLSPLEQNLEKQLTNLIQLFNDVKIHINEPELVEDLNTRLVDAFSKYEYLFKSNFSPENIANNTPPENINTTVQTLERFLNREITENDFIQAERNRLFPTTEWRTLYINNINRLSLKFWNSFFISNRAHYGNNANVRYKELLNHYRLVNAYGENINHREVSIPYPVEYLIETRGPRAKDQTLDVDNLIYAEPHPEAFSTNGMFDFDIISYFNNILSTFLKGCMSEDEHKIYKLCPEYITYTQDSLDNVIDNRYRNIHNLTFYSGGLNYADTISNGINHAIRFDNTNPNILNPYLVSHKTLNEKHIDYFNIYNINITPGAPPAVLNQNDNCLAINSGTLPVIIPAGGIPAVAPGAAGQIGGYTVRRNLNQDQFLQHKFIRRLTIYSNTVRYVNSTNVLENLIDEPLARLRRSTIPAINPIGFNVALPYQTNPSLNTSNSLVIFNSTGNKTQFGGLTLSGNNGEFYRNVDVNARMPNWTLALPDLHDPLIIDLTPPPAVGAVALGSQGYLVFPTDLYVINNLLNFTNSGDHSDLTNPERELFNKNNFIDNNYLGVQLRDFNQENNTNSVLLRSNALVLRNMLNNFNTSPDNKLCLYDNIAEIPQKTKDAMLGTCNYTKYQINILQKLIQTLNRVSNYTNIQQNTQNEPVTMRHRLICNNIFNHINALNKQIDIILLELNDEKFNFGETSVDNFESIKNLTNSEPNVSLNSCLHSYLTDFQQIPVFNNNDLELKDPNSDPKTDDLMENVLDRRLMLLNQFSYYYYNAIDPADVNPDPLALMGVAIPVSFNDDRTVALQLLVAPPINPIDRLRLGRLQFANSLRPNYTTLQSGLYSVRKLYTSNKNKLSLNDFSYLKKIITLFNNSVDIKINENVFNNVLNNMTDLKFNLDDDPFTLTLAAAYRINNQCNNWDSDPFVPNRNAAAPLPAAALAVSIPPVMRRINEYFRHDCSLLLSVEQRNANPEENPLQRHRHRYDFDNIPFVVNSDNIKNDEQQYLNQIRRMLERTYTRRTNVNPFNNKDYLIRMNILDLNIMPVDINAMSREIPLAYLFNYASSLDDFMTDMTEGSIIDRQVLALRDNNSNRNENDTIRSFVDTFFTKYTSAQPEERLNLNPNISCLFDRNKRILLRPGSLLNRGLGFLTAFNGYEFDRNLCYNTFLKTINNMYASHSTRHIINNMGNTTGNNIQKDYEHFMENKKYHGNAPDDTNAYRIRRIGAVQPGAAAVAPAVPANNTQFYYKDLFRGIHKAPLITNNNIRGTYLHNHNEPAAAPQHQHFTDTTLAIQGPDVVFGGVFPQLAPPAGINAAGLFPRNNRVYNENANTTVNNKRAIFPLNNLHGLSALTCGDYVQSITTLNRLDMVEFLNTTFNNQIWDFNNNAYRTIISNDVQNPLYSYFHYHRHNYAHHDLNICYLNRYKVNHIANLRRDDYGLAALAALPAPARLTYDGRLSGLPGSSAVGRTADSIYEMFGRFDIRYIPNALLQDERQRRLARFAHVMSRFLYSDNGFSFTFTRHVYFINFAFNLIRHKIKSESLYNTNKVIQGKLYYQDDYDSYDNIIPHQDTLLRQLPRNPLNNGDYQTVVPNFLGNMRF
jgi:hypothetical protein